MRGLKDKVAVVTGGGQGKSDAPSRRRLAEEGGKVAVFDLKPQAAAETEALAPQRWGAALLARRIGDKRARETWFLNGQHRGSRRRRWASSTRSCRWPSSTRR